MTAMMEKKITILCIDDNEDVCFSLKTLFQTQGWNPHLLHLLHCRRVLYH